MSVPCEDLPIDIDQEFSQSFCSSRSNSSSFSGDSWTLFDETELSISSILPVTPQRFAHYSGVDIYNSPSPVGIRGTGLGLSRIGEFAYESDDSLGIGLLSSSRERTGSESESNQRVLGTIGADVQQGGVSRTLVDEVLYTLTEDPFHAHILTSIPECDLEEEEAEEDVWEENDSSSCTSSTEESAATPVLRQATVEQLDYPAPVPPPTEDLTSIERPMLKRNLSASSVLRRITRSMKTVARSMSSDKGLVKGERPARARSSSWRL